MEKNLTMIRGDTLAFGLEFEGLEQDLSAASFTIKRNLDDVTPLVQKTIGSGISKVSSGQYRVRVAPGDTESLDPGYYNYDCEIQVNNDVFTLFYGILEIVRGVTEQEE